MEPKNETILFGLWNEVDRAHRFCLTVSNKIQRVYRALTSDRAITIYRTIGRTILTVVLLAIACVLLLVDGVRAIHNYAQSHRDTTYTDIEAAVGDRVQVGARVVSGWIKSQRDRAFLFCRISYNTSRLAVRWKLYEVESAARERMAALGTAIVQRSIKV